jgi:hypothetical protein
MQVDYMVYDTSPLVVSNGCGRHSINSYKFAIRGGRDETHNDFCSLHKYTLAPGIV